MRDWVCLGGGEPHVSSASVCGAYVSGSFIKDRRKMFYYYAFKFLHYEAVVHSLLQWECDLASELITKNKL